MTENMNITSDDFFKQYNGHDNRYSTFKLIGVSADQVIAVLNKMGQTNKRIDTFSIGSGEEERGEPTVVSFEGCKIGPELIYPLTRELNCVGFADTAWDEYVFIAAKDGGDYYDFTAEWEDGEPLDRPDDDNCYDAFIKVTDIASGVTFGTGAGAIDKETVDYYGSLVAEH
jgi:hypothetical protein